MKMDSPSCFPRRDRLQQAFYNSLVMMKSGFISKFSYFGR